MKTLSGTVPFAEEDPGFFQLVRLYFAKATKGEPGDSPVAAGQHRVRVAVLSYAEEQTELPYHPACLMDATFLRRSRRTTRW